MLCVFDEENWQHHLSWAIAKETATGETGNTEILIHAVVAPPPPPELQQHEQVADVASPDVVNSTVGAGVEVATTETHRLSITRWRQDVIALESADADPPLLTIEMKTLISEIQRAYNKRSDAFVRSSSHSLDAVSLVLEDDTDFNKNATDLKSKSKVHMLQIAPAETKFPLWGKVVDEIAATYLPKATLVSLPVEYDHQGLKKKSICTLMARGIKTDSVAIVAWRGIFNARSR